MNGIPREPAGLDRRGPGRLPGAAAAELARGARIELGECSLDDAQDIELDAAWSLLDADERERACAFIFPRDRQRFVRAHGYLRRRLGAFLDLAPEAVPIVARKDEKPYVEGRAIDFSLSHSGDHAALAVTDGGDVGLDLELLDWSQRFADDLDGLARACLTEREQAALAAAEGSQRIRRFMAFWTAKEARMKLTGQGLALDPLEIELALLDGEPAAYLRPEAPEAELRFLTLSHPQAVCCLTMRREPGVFTRPGRG